MRMIKTVVMLLGLSGWALTGHAAQDLPFSDGFDTNAVGNQIGLPWTSTAAPIATNSPTPKDGSAIAMYSEDTVMLDIEQQTVSELGPYSNVWFHCYAKVRTHANDAILDVSTEAAAFFVTENGTVKARSNDTWVPFPGVVSSVNDWIGFSVQLDFKTETWNLYTTTNNYTHGAPLQKINGVPLAFSDGYVTPGVEADKELAQVEISGETYLDSIVMTKTVQSIVPATESPEYVATSAGIEIKLDDIYTGVFLKYFETAERTMSGAFGTALKGVLVTGDIVYVFVPGSGWVSYTRQGPSDPWTLGVGASQDQAITPAMAMYIRLSDNLPRESAFVTTFSEVQAVSGVQNIYGTDDTDVGGWNFLAVPDKGTAVSIAGLGLPTPANGDRIYIRQGQGWYSARYLNNTWTSGGGAASATFPAGTPFWYRRNAAGAPEWSY